MTQVFVITRPGLPALTSCALAVLVLGLAGCGGPVFQPQTRVDSDLDGFFAIPDSVNLEEEELTIAQLESLRLDCDDADANTFPNAAEQCDGKDNDCDTSPSPEERDDDGDGYTECGYFYSADGTSEFTGEKDCNDETETGIYQNPGRVEVCAALPLGLPAGEFFESRPDQGLDDDCDGNILEGEVDRDRDGHMKECRALVDLGAFLEDENNNEEFEIDCHDGRADINPSIAEQDSGCIPDEDWTDEENEGNGHNCLPFDEEDRTVWYPDLDYDGDGNVDDGQWVYLCDGELPPGFANNWIQDPTNAITPSDCEDLNPQRNGQDADGDGFTPCDEPGDLYPGGVSADDQDSVYPGAPELCDGLDNDLDGLVDELFDLDDDGSFSDPDVSGLVADNGCVDFYGLTGIDCDDNDSALNAFDLDGDGASTCGVDGIPGTADDDCNDGDPSISVADVDGDGFDTCGLDTDGDGVLDVLPDCDDYDPGLEQQDVDLDSFSTCSGDCDDGNDLVNPAAEHRCESPSVLDNDCDGAIDPNEADTDQDTFTLCAGDCDDQNALLTPADNDEDGSSTCDGECDDTNANVFPGAPQQCESGADPTVLDNDCNGVVDPNEADTDGDGNTLCEGDCNDNDASVEALDADGDGFTTCDGDCNDVFLDNGLFGASQNPGVDADGDGWDVCGGFGVPADCDDSDAALNFNDVDGDGNATCDQTSTDVGAGVLPGDCDDLDTWLNQHDADGDGVTTCDGDCNDSAEDLDTDGVLDGSLVNVNETEVRNGIDDDCDGIADEDAGLIETGAVAVVEMMISTDPSTVGGDGNGEYLELYNPRSEDVDLRGWTVTVSNLVTGDASVWTFPCSSSTVSFCTESDRVEPITIEAGGRFVLARSNNASAHGSDIADFHWEVIPFVDGPFDVNGSGTVSLQFGDDAGSLATVDDVSWWISGCIANCESGNTNPTYGTGNGSPFSFWRPGYAMSLDDTFLGLSSHLDNDAPENWCEQSSLLGDANHGSPGAAGTVGICGP